MTADNRSFVTFPYAGMALDPIHVGTGGTRLGRVDNTIVRDPVTKIPKIPGSSMAGVLRAYTAMKLENDKPGRKFGGKDKPYFPNCAGQGGGDSGHCGDADCPVCAVFGFAKGTGASGGFAGLAAFSDGHVLLFPVATREGPLWVTCPSTLRLIGELREFPEMKEDAIYREQDAKNPLNLGWLMLPVKVNPNGWPDYSRAIDSLGVPEYITARIGVVSDKLFTHVVNSNLEVRTSVAIDPATGAAKEGALFSYEALPRGTVIVWEVTCRNPAHFRINDGSVVAVTTPAAVRDVVTSAHAYLEHLGIGGMGSRGMGRLRVLGTVRVAGEGK
ncbi:MAG: type III-B CRISPR module RAMP protein Cmr4 [Thermovirgaceae bacterium]|nr:type III-B CRISPR module RAMP protein Cmr4 [Thermovirgaceae bacterium]